MGRGALRLTRLLHLTLACLWIGGIVAMLALDLGKPAMARGDVAAIDRAVLQVHELVVIPASYGFLFTGLAFSAFAGFGFVQLWWVAVKWALMLLLSLLIPFVVGPAVAGMAAGSDVLGAAASGDRDYQAARALVRLVLLGELALLVLMLWLSVFRPWGRRAAPASEAAGRRIRLAALLGGAGIAAALGAQAWLLHGLRQSPVAPVPLAALPEGRHCGAAEVGGFAYRVAARIEGGRIVSLDLLEERDSHYARLALGLLTKVMAAQRNDVDAVAGATTISLALRAAVTDALRRAAEGRSACPG